MIIWGFIYGLTTNRAVILVRTSVTEIPSWTAPMTTVRSRNGQHVTVHLATPGSKPHWTG